MTSSSDIVLDEWERAREQLRSGVRTMIVLGLKKGAVYDDALERATQELDDAWEAESDHE